MSGGRDAGRAMQGDARVVACDDQDLAGVDAHAHADRRAVPRIRVQGALGGDGSAYRRGRAGEDDEEGIALRPERHAALCGGGPGHDVPVCAEDLGVGDVADVGSTRVEPSMSVNRKVTTPSGSGSVTPAPAGW